MRPSEGNHHIVGPFPPIVTGTAPCPACGQKFPHHTPPTKWPAFLVDLLVHPDFDYDDYPNVRAACKHCWRPLNGASDCFVTAPGF